MGVFGGVGILVVFGVDDDDCFFVDLLGCGVL